MGILDRLLGRNPTTDWRPQRGLQLLLDLDNETFCGVGLGERADRLEKLGPAEDARAARNGVYDYTSRGFCITTEAGRVVEFELTYAAGEPTFAGTVRRHGQPLLLSPETAEQDVIAALGAAPAKRDQRGNGEDRTVTLHYRGPRADWMIELGAEGRLESLWIGKRD